jgi:Fe-S cluster assembly protein SufD
MMRAKKIETGGYPALYAAVKGSLPGAALPWLVQSRADALAQFSAAGFPSRRSEAWRYTSLAPLMETAFAPALGAPSQQPPLNQELLLSDAGSIRFVFVDGRLNRALSYSGPLPEGLEIQAVGEAIAGQSTALAGDLQVAGDLPPFRALNAAFLMDGVIIKIAEGAQIALPIEIHHVMTAKADGQAAHLHHVIMAGAGSRATILESHEGTGAYWTNLVTDVVLGKGARLDSYKIQREGAGGVHLAEADVRLASEAYYANFMLLTGGQTLRNDIRLRFEGGHAECHLSGAYLTHAGQSHEVATLVDHATPDNISRQAYRAVLGAKAHTAFQGKILVRQDAQRTNADQSNHNLVLHRSADANTRPELEIHADDVKCSHGATVGELDQNALFYMKARGIEEASARNLLIEAFIGSLIDEIPNVDVQTIVRAIAADAQKSGGGWTV